MPSGAKNTTTPWSLSKKASLPPKKLHYEDYMLLFELLFKDFSGSNLSEEDLLFAKSDLRNVAYSSFRVYNRKYHKLHNITKSEHKAFLELKKLVETEKVVIQKADKGNVVVLLDKKRT